ncbi:hypothetical protein NDU88_003996 [Pleurodeles waltl]|uniref:Uncharacterized protein n=1 Tax=Pleurodeles waltl TaxID=8319 RepID=A0AAV7PG71_PLEWA|nr:hypothetical protein NDU88_003996 [Pleurodeles waltl]
MSCSLERAPAQRSREYRSLSAGTVGREWSSKRSCKQRPRTENRRAWIATKRLQGTDRKVAKSRIEIEGKLNTMEESTMAVEADVEALRVQCASQDGQLTDIMWKLEDHENRQRRNNLRFLGIGEGVEGNDIRAYMIEILRDAFPELTNWDWEIKVQRVHRFPAVSREGGSIAESKCPRAILVFFGNFLLRQAIFEKALPDTPRSADGVTFFYSTRLLSYHR